MAHVVRPPPNYSYTASRALASPYNPACRSQPLRRCCRSSRLASLAVAYTLTGGAMAVANAEALMQRGLSVPTVIALYPCFSVGGGFLPGVCLPLDPPLSCAPVIL